MILYVEDILKEVNILNWYKGEAIKNGDADAVFIQTAKDEEDALRYYLRDAVTDILLFANANRVTFTCERKDDMLRFVLTPLREGREHMLDIMKEAIRQYLVYEVRRLWMMNVRPDWADVSMRESLRENIREAMNNVTAMGKKVRRRYSLMGI